ncbi:MAG: alpha/beta hydrolase [Actinomycetota bacterium]|nr:alpha/beta hydrolase [Actinomycetota bacterium]
MDDATIAEARAYNAELARSLEGMRPVETVPPAVTRAARREGRGIDPPPVFLPHAQNLEIPGRSGPIRVRVLAPEAEAAGVYLHFHGGGWVLGACDMQDPRLWELVQQTGLCAVSVDYRLAPEHPYPAGPDDCEDVARWLVDGGAGALGAPKWIAIGGESAGAHLAVLTLLRLRDDRDAGAFRAANLIFGAFDLSMQQLQGEAHPSLTPSAMRWFAECFLPGLDVEARRDPGVSPLYADVAGLPPALFTVGALDVLLDDSVHLEERWRAAGNDAELRIWPEAVHGFTSFPLALGRAALQTQYTFLRERLPAAAS